MTLSLTTPCHYAECGILHIVMLIVIMLSVLILSVVMLNCCAECRGAVTNTAISQASAFVTVYHFLPDSDVCWQG